ncbi:MAG: hypothetical protein QOI41_711 [Myxococcales bacterium]|nr:hypothetical protein [Myxococcales bacterium]
MTNGLNLRRALAATTSSLVMVAAGACSLTTSLDGLSHGPDDTALEGGGGDAGSDALLAGDQAATADGDSAASNDAAGGATYAAVVLADDPLLYYRLGETDVTKPARDSSKSQRAATFKGAVVCGLPGAIANDSDTACRFDGTTTAVFAANGPTFAGAPGPSYSLEAWAHPTSYAGPNGHVVAAVEQESNDGYSIFFYLDASPRLERETPMGTDGIFASPIAGTTFVHLVGTFDGTMQRLYVDGVLQKQAASSKTFLGNHNAPFSIGANSQADTNLFVGEIDEVALYDHVLSPERIKLHHDVGRGLVTP